MTDLRVLLVEDNDDTGAALTMLLQHAGYEVEWTRSAAETVSRMETLHENGRRLPDVLVLDLMLPDATGPELVEQLEAIGPVPPIVVHSAAAEWVLRAAAVRVHAAATLRKPIEGARLVSAIDTAVGSSEARRA